MTVLRPLVCPYCSGALTAELIYTHHYSEHRDLDGYSCDDCCAEWGKDGAPTTGPDEGYWRIGKPEDAAPPWLATDRLREETRAALAARTGEREMLA